MISPDINRKLVQEIFELYGTAEAVMLKKVSKRIERGVKEDGWTERKFVEMVSLRQDLDKTLKNLDRLSRKKIEAAIADAYKRGVNSANSDFGIVRALLNDIQVPMSVQRLVMETNQMIEQTHLRILRTTTDAYRDIIANTSTGVVSGVETRLQAAQQALNQFADRGITSFVDKAGRRWEMATYAEAATRSTTGRAAIQGHIDRQSEIGRDLVIISDHPSECPLCRPWEGQILSLSGNDPNHRSLQEATSSGLFHVNCRHTLTGYIPGLTKNVVGKPDPEGYETSQQQRSNERQIRKWKKREVVAITPEEQQKASSKVREWQAKQRELLEDTDLRRKYNRESITRAR